MILAIKLEPTINSQDDCLHGSLRRLLIKHALIFPKGKAGRCTERTNSRSPTRNCPTIHVVGLLWCVTLFCTWWNTWHQQSASEQCIGPHWDLVRREDIIWKAAHSIYLLVQTMSLQQGIISFLWTDASNLSVVLLQKVVHHPHTVLFLIRFCGLWMAHRGLYRKSTTY
jgi:hypothetical protein